MKIWQRYLFKQWIQSFCFFLISIFTLYTIIDFSIRGNKIVGADLNLSEIALHYLYSFSLYFDLFGSIAFLLSSLKVLIYCNIHQELTSLQMAGLSKRKLLSPFFLLAFFLMIASYANSEWLTPHAGIEAALFKSEYGLKKLKKEKVFSLTLPDESKIVYQNFDLQNLELFDLYWIRSGDDLWYMKHLNLISSEGRWADHFVRNDKGQLEKKESFSLKNFSELVLDKDLVLHKFVASENRPLSTLFLQSLSFSSQIQSIKSHLYYKLACGLFPFLILLSISSRAFSFARGQSSFLFVAYGLFGLIAFTTLFNGMLILAENGVLPASLAIWGPIGCMFMWGCRSFYKIL